MLLLMLNGTDAVADDVLTGVNDGFKKRLSRVGVMIRRDDEEV